MRRAHLSGDVLELVARRVIVLALFAWLPLLALSIVEGHAWGESVKLPFLVDVDVHARFLLALPLLMYAELIVHQRMRLVVGAFVKRGLVPDDARADAGAAHAHSKPEGEPTKDKIPAYWSNVRLWRQVTRKGIHNPCASDDVIANQPDAHCQQNGQHPHEVPAVRKSHGNCRGSKTGSAARPTRTPHRRSRKTPLHAPSPREFHKRQR